MEEKKKKKNWNHSKGKRQCDSNMQSKRLVAITKQQSVGRSVGVTENIGVERCGGGAQFVLLKIG